MCIAHEKYVAMQGLYRGSIPDFAATHCATGSTEKRQNCTYDHQNDTDRRQNADRSEVADQRQNDTQNDHGEPFSLIRFPDVHTGDCRYEIFTSQNTIRVCGAGTCPRKSLDWGTGGYCCSFSSQTVT